MSIELEEQVETLESVLKQFVKQTGAALLRMERGTKVFRKEVRGFINEMREDAVRWGPEIHEKDEPWKAEQLLFNPHCHSVGIFVISGTDYKFSSELRFKKMLTVS